jgi:magnesium-transporting ATPase (P-type)
MVCLFRTDDAPSLKKADCGIAVEGASDAARTAADVVFLDEGLSTIITSIKVARQIFHRERSDALSLAATDCVFDNRHESLHYLPYCSLYTS